MSTLIDPASLAVFRDRSSPPRAFRAAARTVCAALVRELQRALTEEKIAGKDLVLVMILRSGVAFLDCALQAFPDASVGFAGLRRDEETAVPSWYCESIPPVDGGRTVVVFDPMLATGGSAEETVSMLLHRGADAGKIRFVGVLAAPEGVERLAKLIPRDHMILGKIDDGLDDRKFIVPGLGDFGDRYLATAAPL